MTPSFDFTLSSALLIPDFVEQALALDLFAQVGDTHITPLDDLKEWMRSDPWRSGELFERAGELLLGPERAARKAAEKAGLEFDLAGFELERMEGEPGYETFDPAWTVSLLRLALDEADAVQAFSRKAHEADFALAVSFHLPDPRKHPRFSREAIAAALVAHGGTAPAGSLAAGRAPRLELDGAFQLDLSAPGGGPVLVRGNGVGFVRVPCADPRVGDGTVAHLSLAYPLESEGYFLMTFDALRQALSLKTGIHAS
jgi:hypothetical protein